MTKNQIAYQELQERRRANQKSESIAFGTLSETSRHNQAYENETQRHNMIIEDQALVDLGIKSRNAATNERNASVNEMNAQTNVYNAQINAQNADTNAYNAQTNRYNAESNRISAYAQQTSASAALKQADVANVRAAEEARHNRKSEVISMGGLNVQRTNAASQRMTAEANVSNATSQRMSAEAQTTQAEVAQQRADTESLRAEYQNILDSERAKKTRREANTVYPRLLLDFVRTGKDAVPILMGG